MIGERKGSKILSCTHAGRVITLVPVAEVFPWHLDPLFIMHQITHGVVSAAWQNQHLHLCSPHSLHRRKTNMTYECPELLMSKLISGSRKHNALYVKRKRKKKRLRSTELLKDGICSNLLIFVIILHHHINQLLCLQDIIHCLSYDNMHWNGFSKGVCAAFWTSNIIVILIVIHLFTSRIFIGLHICDSGLYFLSVNNNKKEIICKMCKIYWFYDILQLFMCRLYFGN